MRPVPSSAIELGSGVVVSDTSSSSVAPLALFPANVITSVPVPVTLKMPFAHCVLVSCPSNKVVELNITLNSFGMFVGYADVTLLQKLKS